MNAHVFNVFLAPGEARNLPSEPKRRICGEMGAGGGGRGGVELRNVVDLRYGCALTILKKNLPVKYRNELNHGSIELVRVRVSVKCEGKLRLLLWNKRKSVFVQKIKESHR